MTTSTLTRALAPIGLLAMLVTASSAQQTFTRTVLQRGDLSVAGREAIMGRGDFPPGTETGKHTHFGEEIGYVLAGTMMLEVQGKAPITLKTGDVFMIPAGHVHSARNTGTTPAQVLATYVVEKGKTLTTPAP